METVGFNVGFGKSREEQLTLRSSHVAREKDYSPKRNRCRFGVVNTRVPLSITATKDKIRFYISEKSMATQIIRKSKLYLYVKISISITDAYFMRAKHKPNRKNIFDFFKF